MTLSERVTRNVFKTIIMSESILKSLYEDEVFKWQFIPRCLVPGGETSTKRPGCCVASWIGAVGLTAEVEHPLLCLGISLRSVCRSQPWERRAEAS